MKKRVLLFFLAATTLFVGCKEAEIVEENINQTRVENVTKVAESTVSDGEDDEKLKEYFDEWAETNLGFLLSSYENPVDMNVDYAVIASQIGISPVDESTLDMFYNPAVDTLWGDKCFYKKSDVAELIKKNTGLELNDQMHIYLPYSKEADGYLDCRTDTMWIALECKSFEHEDDKYTVHFVNTDNQDYCTAKYKKTNDGFIITANKLEDESYNTVMSTENYDDLTIIKEAYLNDVDNPFQVTEKRDEKIIYENLNDYYYWFVYGKNGEPLYAVNYNVYDGATSNVGTVVVNGKPYFKSVLFDVDEEASLPQNVTLYGDTIRVKEEIGDYYQFLVGVENPQVEWSEPTEKNLKLSIESEEFKPYENAKEVKELMDQVVLSLGKGVGDTFIIHDEGTGGGSVDRKYTIISIN